VHAEGGVESKEHPVEATAEVPGVIVKTIDAPVATVGSDSDGLVASETMGPFGIELLVIMGFPLLEMDASVPVLVFIFPQF